MVAHYQGMHLARQALSAGSSDVAPVTHNMCYTYYVIGKKMQNLTLAVEPDVLLAARKLALERNTTVNRLVRDYLAELVQKDSKRAAALARIRQRMKDGLYEVGKIDWKREDIYER